MKKRIYYLRNIVAVFQAVIDSLIMHQSFVLVIDFWLGGKTPATFTPEVSRFFIGTMLVVFFSTSLYKFRTYMLWDEIKAVLKASFFILLLIVLYTYAQKIDLSRFVVSFGIMLFIPLCLASRFIIRRTLFALGILRTNIIILGAGRTGKIFAEKVASNPFTLGKVTGFLDDDPAKIGTTVAGIKVLGKLDDFTEISERQRIDEVVVAISSASRAFLARILGIVEFSVRQVHYIPDTYMLTAFSPFIRDVGGMPVATASKGLRNPVNRAVKAFVDYVGAFVAVVVFSPFMVYAALRAKIRYGRKILSGQKRIGLHGKKFIMYRFRSSGGGKTDKHMRRSYIDEFPQLINVLKGEMSLVGPKAFLPGDAEHIYSEDTARRISAFKPGITGFWQISDRERDLRICGEMNLYYIRNWSLWLDAVILTKTFFIILFRKH